MADTMDSFSKILSSAEFLSGNFLRKAEELYGITISSHDLFKAFTADALRRFAPSLLDTIGYPRTIHTMNWPFSGTSITHEFGQEDELSAVNEAPGQSRLPTSFPTSLDK